MGSGSSTPSVVPFNENALMPFMPSVFNGPYNVAGAQQNAQMLQAKYPWITLPAGSFAGTMPGQYAGAGTAGFGRFGRGMPASAGVTNPNPPAPTQAQIAQYGPQATMQPPVNTSGGGAPVQLADILAALNPQRTQ